MRDYDSTDLAGAAYLARDDAHRPVDRPHPSEYMDDLAPSACMVCGFDAEGEVDCPRCGERL